MKDIKLEDYIAFLLSNFAYSELEAENYDLTNVFNQLTEYGLEDWMKLDESQVIKYKNAAKDFIIFMDNNRRYITRQKTYKNISEIIEKLSNEYIGEDIIGFGFAEPNTIFCYIATKKGRDLAALLLKSILITEGEYDLKVVHLGQVKP